MARTGDWEVVAGLITGMLYLNLRPSGYEGGVIFTQPGPITDILGELAKGLLMTLNDHKARYFLLIGNR